MGKDNFLFISDVHLPFEHKHALAFVKKMREEFEVPHENVYSVGDLADLYNFSRWPKSPDAKHTVNQELEAVREKLRKWQAAFPEMKICQSNHDSRIMKKAMGAELPSQIVKSFEEIFELPKEWELAEQFVVCSNQGEFIVEHGESWTSMNGLREAVLHYGISVVKGHTHVRAGVTHIWTKHQRLWGLDVGCLIDDSQYSFEYSKFNKLKSVIGCGVLVAGVPYFLPLM